MGGIAGRPLFANYGAEFKKHILHQISIAAMHERGMLLAKHSGIDKIAEHEHGRVVTHLSLALKREDKLGSIQRRPGLLNVWLKEADGDENLRRHLWINLLKEGVSIPRPEIKLENVVESNCHDKGVEYGLKDGVKGRADGSKAGLEDGGGEGEDHDSEDGEAEHSDIEDSGEEA